MGILQADEGKRGASIRKNPWRVGLGRWLQGVQSGKSRRQERNKPSKGSQARTLSSGDNGEPLGSLFDFFLIGGPRGYLKGIVKGNHMRVESGSPVGNLW